VHALHVIDYGALGIPALETLGGMTVLHGHRPLSREERIDVPLQAAAGPNEKGRSPEDDRPDGTRSALSPVDRGRLRHPPSTANGEEADQGKRKPSRLEAGAGAPAALGEGQRPP